jgi:hypothetical protein
MKKDLKFNHDADGALKSLGLTFDQCTEEFIDVQEKLIASEATKFSQISECIHKNFTYEHILLLATKEYFNEITKD